MLGALSAHSKCPPRFASSFFCFFFLCKGEKGARDNALQARRSEAMRRTIQARLRESAIGVFPIEVTLLAALAAAACGSPGHSVASVQALVPDDPTSPALFAAPTGEVLQFGVEDGPFGNYFHRQGGAAAHLVTRSGNRPRFIAAFPANNQGIALWFRPAPADTRLWIGEADDAASVARGGDVTAVTRQANSQARESFGVRAKLRSNMNQLSVQLALLANLRSVRDYGYGVCLEDAAQFPELRNETIELLPDSNVVRFRRVQLTGNTLELLLRGEPGTQLAVRQEVLTPRPGCPASAGSASQVVDIQAEGGIQLELIALSDETPLTPIDPGTPRIRDRADAATQHDALAFLSYSEKLLAGSWRFLTYFGRDTLLSLRLLMPAVSPALVEAGLAAVIERINLDANARDTSFDFAIDPGDVAHEEEVGDFAAWKNSTENPSADPRAPRYDYKMVDDDFLLAPVLLQYLDSLGSGPEALTARDAFLNRTRGDGRTFADAVLANLALVLTRARPFAEDPAAPADKKAKLVGLKPGVPVGEWRDSNSGLAFGRHPFDVNAGLVPGALEAAAALYTRLGRSSEAADATSLLGQWRGVEELFRIDEPLATVESNVASYASAIGITDTGSELVAESDGLYSYYGIALDATGQPLPVLHTDHGFVFEFTAPADVYLIRAATTIGSDFPAGLNSELGFVVANPALASPDLSIVDPHDLASAEDDASVAFRSLFTTAQYHGTVVWSWQQALLASGVRRQLRRDDIGLEARAALERLECKLWSAISATSAFAAHELWSWQATGSGSLMYEPFGFNLADVDESNAIQLWSTVFQSVQPPSAEDNPRCAAR
jgi:hypothetical protein